MRRNGGRRWPTHRPALIATFLLAVSAVVAVPPEAVAQVPPPNDDFAAATVLASDAGSLLGETNVDATVESGEPAHNGITASRSVWYEWTPSQDGTAVLDGTSQPYSAHWLVLAVYAGSSLGGLTEVASKGGLGFHTIGLEFPVSAGTTYRVVVDGSDSGETGLFDLTWDIPSPPNDSFADATTFSADSGSLPDETNRYASAESGEPGHAGLAGTPARSVWYAWTPAADGTAVIETTVPTSPNDWDTAIAVYTGGSVDALTEIGAASGFGYTVSLQVEVAAGTTYHIAIDGHDIGQYGDFALSWVNYEAPANDDFGAGVEMVGDEGSLTGNTNSWATAEPGEPNHDGWPATPVHSVWFEWTPSVDAAATVVVATPPSPDDWDSVLAVYTGGAVDSLTAVAADSTAGTTLTLVFPVAGGTTYHLAIDGQTIDQMGDFDLEWSVWPDSQYFVVTKTEDTADGTCDSDCSLREATIAANLTPGDDTIELPAGIYLLTIKGGPSVNPEHGDLDIASETGTTTIVGSGRDVTVIDASGLRAEPVPNPDRVFTVHYHAGLELAGVTVTGGYVISGVGGDLDGGGILNWNGYLTLTDCLIEGNVSGENGGGIANRIGPATISNTIVRSNHTNPPEYNTGSNGGGIYNSGTMTIADSSIQLNETDWGGGIFSEEIDEQYPATLDIVDSVIVDNAGGRGGGLTSRGGAVAALNGVTIAGNNASGYSGRGGGVYNWGAEMTIVDSTIDGNETSTNNHGPPAGSGGGISNELGTITISGTTISNNTAIGEQWDTSPLLGGRGGGMVNAGGIATVMNSTLSGNAAFIADRWDPYSYAYLDGGAGGGVAHMPAIAGFTAYCPFTVLDGVTITDNVAAHGGGINSRWEADPLDQYAIPELSVGPYAYECPDFYITNSIVAANTVTVTAGTEDSWGSHTSLGHNLVGDGTGVAHDGPGDRITSNPRLAPLADNGGPTQTHGLLAGSPALDAGATDLGADQRGVARPQGLADDIGAFELEQPIGWLRVTSDPAVPSQVLLDGVPMDTWGLTWVKVPVGDYELSFTDVQGFSTPASQLVTVVEGTTTAVNGPFVERGWLQVTTTPALPATIYVDGSPMNDWGVWTDLEAGSYEVCFGAVADYDSPGCATVDVFAGVTTSFNGTFTPNPGSPGPSGHGYLRVTTNPAVPAQILIDGIPRDSWGLNWVKLDPGVYEVAFTDIQGFTTPDPQTITINPGETTVIQGDYTERGWLQVTTSPPLPGTIYVDGIPRNDWGMWTDMEPGSYDVCFGDAPGWVTPACAIADVIAGTLTTETGTYTPQP